MDNILVKDDFGVSINTTLYEDDSTTVFDVSEYDSVNILIRKPSGSIISREATLVSDGTDGRIKVILEEGDLDEHGKWAMQPRAIGPSIRVTFTESHFDVEFPIDEDYS